MSLLEQDCMRKGRVNNTLPKLKTDLEFEFRSNKKYEVEAIIDSVVYGQQADGSDQIPGLDYFVL